MNSSTFVIIGMFAITGAIVISTSFPITHKLAFFVMPVVIIFFASAPFYALMFLLIIRPELELFSESGILKFFSAVPVIFLFYIFFTRKYFSFCWSRLKYLYIFILLALSTLVLSININESLIYILRLLSIISVYLITYNLIKTRDEGMKILYCFPIALVIPLIIGGKQFLLGEVHITAATQFERVYSFFVLANSFSRFLFVTLFASIPLFYYLKKRSTPLYLLAFATIATMILLKVRGVFFTMVVAFLILFYFTPKIRKYFWLVIPAVILSSIPIALKLLEHMIHPLQQRIYGGETFFWRLDMWEQLFHNAFKRSPLIGFGTGTSINISSAYTMFTNYPHNDYLRILIENGILGLIFYLAFFVSNLRSSYKEIKNDENKYFNVCAFILIFSFIFMSSAANVFYSTDYFWYFFSFLAVTHKMNSLRYEGISGNVSNEVDRC